MASFAASLLLGFLALGCAAPIQDPQFALLERRDGGLRCPDGYTLVRMCRREAQGATDFWLACVRDEP
jgi:hypothetical protein